MHIAAAVATPPPPIDAIAMLTPLPPPFLNWGVFFLVIAQLTKNTCLINTARERDTLIKKMILKPLCDEI